MAATRKLKVYRTAAGFNDLYVAASSQKAALAAWGSEHDLFARGVAELVTDPALSAEPLASPGSVVKRSRGTAADQLAALPPVSKKARSSDDASEAPSKAAPSDAKPKPAPKPKQKPSRADVDRAEADLDAITDTFARQLQDIAKREAALARERRTLERQRDEDLDDAKILVDKARRQYDAAVRDWKS